MENSLISYRFVFGLGGTGTCASSATSWQVSSRISNSVVRDPTMQVACAESKDLHVSTNYTCIPAKYGKLFVEFYAVSSVTLSFS